MVWIQLAQDRSCSGLYWMLQ